MKIRTIYEILKDVYDDSSYIDFEDIIENKKGLVEVYEYTAAEDEVFLEHDYGTFKGYMWEAEFDEIELELLSDKKIYKKIENGRIYRGISI